MFQFSVRRKRALHNAIKATWDAVTFGYSCRVLSKLVYIKYINGLVSSWSRTIPMPLSYTRDTLKWIWCQYTIVPNTFNGLLTALTGTSVKFLRHLLRLVEQSMCRLMYTYNQSAMLNRPQESVRFFGWHVHVVFFCLVHLFLAIAIMLILL